MMTAPPAKIKSFLATVKAKLDEETSAEDASANTSCYHDLIRMELLQRGVIVNDDVLAAVQTNAGKALLDDASSSLPKPLLAGSAVIAGRIAEKLAAGVNSFHLANREEDDDDDCRTSAIISRCKEVNDERLLHLLQLATDTTVATTTAEAKFYTVAEGYFYRAASFQPDAPPMWKKAWDCVTSRLEKSDTISWESITAVSNLLRIAQIKGNIKRVAELSLVLTDCYLDAVKKPTETDHAALTKTFVGDYRPCAPDSDKAVEHAVKALQQVPDNASLLSGQDAVYFMLLQLRVRTAQEEENIRKQAAADYEKAKNRAVEKKKGIPTATTTVSLASCLQDARRMHLAEYDDSNKRDGDEGLLSIEQSAVAVRDALLLEQTTEHHHHQQGCKLLDQYILRLQEKAQALAVTKGQDRGWMDAASFIQPLLVHWKERWAVLESALLEETGSTALPIEEIFLMETSCALVPCIEWMCCGARAETGLLLPVDLLVLTMNMLLVLEKRRAAALLKQKEQSKSVVATGSDDDTIRVKLEYAYATTRALLALQRTNGEDDSDVLHQITDTAVSRTTSGGDLVGELGFSFFEFLACWSGFHHPAWAFCTQPEARILVARARSSLGEAHSKWGRPTSPLEAIILCLGEADAEGASFDGGLAKEAQKNYATVLEAAESFSNRILSDLIMAHCFSGQAKLLMREQTNVDEHHVENFADAIARNSLERLESVALDTNDRSFYMWHSNEFITDAVRFQIANSRQLIADALLRKGDAFAAQTFLEDAVRDSPLDSGAAFALGSFRLYMAFFGTERSAENDKAAQVQLLRAAKMDSSKAGPFALLGYWYEYKADLKRAIGCYSKALLLDASHPVAGRGVLRLVTPANSLTNVLEKAIDTSSAVSGWAWRAIGLRKALVEGKDELAVVSFLKALRCRDIERAEVEPLAVFYANPDQPELPGKGDLSSTLADLAACYRRLGRYTAAIRSFESAIEAAGDKVDSLLLCSCAQAEMELGLFDDAEEKFLRAMNYNDQEMLPVAAYGRGVSLLAMARRDNQDGKAGSAFTLIQQAVDTCSKMGEAKNVCFQKLLADLHTFGASLPPAAFLDNCDASSLNDEALLRTQLSFVAKGEESYRDAESFVDGSGEDSDILRASLISDEGSNLLLQAQLISVWEGKGLHHKTLPEASKRYESAAAEFLRALKLCPIFAPAWCGFGCAVARSDPLMAQHAFSRALELDNLSPDPYANLSFLYTAHKCFTPSVRISDALTEVADTPMMWINRALMLELEAAMKPGDFESRDNIRQAADAYRAALQVVKHPSAMLGLAMTCRMDGGHQSDLMIESHSYATEYLGLVGRSDAPVFTFHGVSKMESGVTKYSGQSDELVKTGWMQVVEGLERLEEQPLDVFGTPLDKEIFRNLTTESQCRTVLGDSEASEIPLQRQVMNEPNRGDLWVKLAKELVLGVTPSASRNEVEPGLLAARRASMILMQQLTKELSMPSGSQQSQTFVRAEDLSDALSLVHWMANESSPAAKKWDEQSTPPPSHIDLQRALLISPGNQLAREALNSTSAQFIEN